MSEPTPWLPFPGGAAKLSSKIENTFVLLFRKEGEAVAFEVAFASHVNLRGYNVSDQERYTHWTPLTQPNL